MTFLKTLWSDLVEKRLWPVALVLLVTLVAVPVALGGSTPPVAPLPPATGPTGAGGAAQTAQVGLDAAVPLRRDRAGKVRDPFAQRKVRKVAAATSSTATASVKAVSTTVAGRTAGAGGTTPAGTTGAGGSSGGPSSPEQAATPEPQESYVVEIRFGRTNGTRSRKVVERLTPLPSAENPFFVHLGVLADEGTAVFLLSSDVKATGDGACKPRASSCETVELQRGDTEFFDVVADDGTVTQYQLDVLRITKKTAGTPSRAVAARTGTTEAEEELGSERYVLDQDTGLLRRVQASAGTRTAADDDAGPEEGASPDAGSPSAGAPQP